MTGESYVLYRVQASGSDIIRSDGISLWLDFGPMGQVEICRKMCVHLPMLCLTFGLSGGFKLHLSDAVVLHKSHAGRRYQSGKDE